MTTYSSLGVWGVVLAATAGSVAGALVLYWVGRMLNAERLEKWLGESWDGFCTFARMMWKKRASGLKSAAEKAVFLCRFIPIVRSLISVPAGMTRMNVSKFLAFSAAGTFLWNLVLVNLGAFMGASWEKNSGRGRRLRRCRCGGCCRGAPGRGLPLLQKTAGEEKRDGVKGSRIDSAFPSRYNKKEHFTANFIQHGGK